MTQTLKIPRWLRAYGLVVMLGLTSFHSAAQTAVVEAVRLSGSGAAYTLLPALLAAYREATPDSVVQLTLVPLGSNGSIRVMVAGRIEVVIIGRQL